MMTRRIAYVCRARLLDDTWQNGASCDAPGRSEDLNAADSELCGIPVAGQPGSDAKWSVNLSLHLQLHMSLHCTVRGSNLVPCATRLRDLCGN